MFPLDESTLTESQREQLAIHRADCLAVLGREFCGYECMKCGLCTKWSHGRHKAARCNCPRVTEPSGWLPDGRKPEPTGRTVQARTGLCDEFGCTNPVAGCRATGGCACIGRCMRCEDHLR